MTIDNNVVCRLRRIRTGAGQSQKAVLDGANWYIENLELKCPELDRISLSKAENESVILIPDHVFAIAAFLDCSMHDIYPEFYPEVPAD